MNRRKKYIEAIFQQIKKYPLLVELNPKDYHISVWEKGEDIDVKFDCKVNFTPCKSESKQPISNFTIRVNENEISAYIQQKITSLIEHIQKHKKEIVHIASIFKFPSGNFITTIHEEEDYYQIDISNDVAFGKYWIDKVTGKEVMGSIESSYAIDPHPPLFDEEQWVEVWD